MNSNRIKEMMIMSVFIAGFFYLSQKYEDTKIRNIHALSNSVFAVTPQLVLEQKSIDELLEEKYQDFFKIPINKNKDSVFVSSNNLLNDSSLWRMLLPESLDPLPEDLRNRIIEKQFSGLEKIFEEDTWKNMSANDWDEIPRITRMTAFLKMAVNKAKKYDLQKNSNLPDIDKWFAAIIVQESYLDHRAINYNFSSKKASTKTYVESTELEDKLKYLSEVNVVSEKKYVSKAINKNYNGADLGLGQHSDFARKYLRSKKEFRNISDEQFFNPDSALDAAAFYYLNELIDCKKNVKLAIKAYNVGILNAINNTSRAKEYFTWVQRRYDLLTSQKTKETSPVWYEIIKRATLNNNI